MDAGFWNERYSHGHFVYGESPNGFLAECAAMIPGGPVLCVAEGEGRNAVFLAGLGHKVTAVDQSDIGLAKARQFAARRGVHLETACTDLADYPLAPGAWSGIVAIFAHLPPDLRRRMHRDAVHGLQPGGVFILEAYTPAQLAFDTGGPKAAGLLMSLSDLREELSGLDFLVARETERDIREGMFHTGLGAVVQILARKPAQSA